jgi:predicted dithiol-disulfide oxidoreductase (DUF899 family)
MTIDGLGEATLPDLFGEKQTLVVYSYMFGPAREKPCPMCTSFMSTWEAKLPDVEQRVAFVFVARSPIARLIEAKKARGWARHRIYSDPSGDYTRDYVSKEDADAPGYSVFTRRDGTVRHFWSGQMGQGTADPGQDPRGGFRSALDRPRHYTGRPRQGLVSELELLNTDSLWGNPHNHGVIFVAVPCIWGCLRSARL